MKHLHVFRNNSISLILSRKYCNCRARVLEHVRVVCYLVRQVAVSDAKNAGRFPPPPRSYQGGAATMIVGSLTPFSRLCNKVQWRLSTPLFRSSSFNLHFMRIISESIIHMRLLCSRYYFSDIITLWSIAVNAMNSFEKTRQRDESRVKFLCRLFRASCYFRELCKG